MMFTTRERGLLFACLAGGVLLAGCLTPNEESGSDSVALRTAGKGKGKGHARGNGGGAGMVKAYVCHIPPGNPANAHTIHVGSPAVQAHLAHGDKLGKCVDPIPNTRPCDDAAPAAKAKGSGWKGGVKATICHIPPGNPANAHTIHVGLAAVEAHMAHGDKLGSCPGGDSVRVIPRDCDTPPVDTNDTDTNPPVTNPPVVDTTIPPVDTNDTDTNPPVIEPPADTGRPG